MAGKIKTVRKGFDYRQCDDFAAYLNHMARLGWHFRQWRAGLVFEQGEPEDAFYCVEVFSGGSEYDTRPEPKTQEFAEYCEAAGWELIDARRKFCVFKRVREDAVPIMTDGERLESIFRATRGEIWSPVFTAAVFTAMRFGDYAMAFERYIFSDMFLTFTAVWVLFLIMGLLRCGLFYVWKFRCKKRLEEGKRLFFGKGRQTFAAGWYSHLSSFALAALMVILMLLGEVWMVVIYAVFAGVLILGAALIAKFRPDALSNQIIQIIGSAVLILLILSAAMFAAFREKDSEKNGLEPPLTYADMGIELELEDIRYSDEQDGLLGNWRYVNLDYGTDYLFYDVYETEHHWILEKIWEKETSGKANETREDCTALWGAREAFRNGAGEYLVRCDKAIWILSLSLEEPLTQGQIDAVIAALREG